MSQLTAESSVRSEIPLPTVSGPPHRSISGNRKRPASRSPTTAKVDLDEWIRYKNILPSFGTVQIFSDDTALPPLASSDLATDSLDSGTRKRALESEHTARGYFSGLQRYWIVWLKPQGYETVDDWTMEVRHQEDSSDIMERRRWAVELEASSTAMSHPRTGRPLVKGGKNMLVMSVISYIKHSLGDRLDQSYSITLGSKTEGVAEIRRKEASASHSAF